MTNAEAKRALETWQAVECDGIEYERICAIRYSNDRAGGEIRVSVQLLDRCGHSTTTTTPDRVKIKE